MHVAIVMDGNRRWARQRGLSAAEGYAAGETALYAAVRSALAGGVRTLTVFGFSKENWTRDPGEISALMQLFSIVPQRRRMDLLGAGVRVRICGELGRLAFAARSALRGLERVTACNTRMTLVLAINYGGRDEIVRAAQSLARAGTLPGAIDEAEFRKHLFLPDVSDPDIVIRTGGEQRLSNFLLFQLAYSEILTLPVLWPDFTGDDFTNALAQLATRRRTFGA
ncbi:MAG: polyprenyl diphosphate synthase [Candidatus Baltobacteraceae bacterium]